MRCGAGDPKACLNDHIFPALPGAKLNETRTSLRAFAPCHDDRAPSLSVSIGAGHVIWNCFACSELLGRETAQAKTRNALITRMGVSPACLPLARSDALAELEAIREIATGKDSHAHKVLQIAALLAGYDALPRGDALEALAESCGVSMREAYRARSGLTR